MLSDSSSLLLLMNNDRLWSVVTWTIWRLQYGTPCTNRPVMSTGPQSSRYVKSVTGSAQHPSCRTLFMISIHSFVVDWTCIIMILVIQSLCVYCHRITISNHYYLIIIKTGSIQRIFSVWIQWKLYVLRAIFKYIIMKNPIAYYSFVLLFLRISVFKKKNFNLFLGIYRCTQMIVVNNEYRTGIDVCSFSDLIIRFHIIK